MTANRTRTAGSATKKTTATKKATAAKKPPAKKQATKKSAAAAPPASSNGHDSGQAPRAESAPRMGAVELAGRAAQQLADLTGRPTEGVTRMERSEHGWTVELEVLELRRIPETTDVLATYEAQLDDRGRLEGYQRLHRYVRGAAGQERS